MATNMSMHRQRLTETFLETKQTQKKTSLTDIEREHVELTLPTTKKCAIKYNDRQVH